MKSGLPVVLAILSLLFGCASLATAPRMPEQAMAMPEAFSADYQWVEDAPPPGYEQAPSLLHLVGRRGQVVRAVGLTFFGSTVFDFVLRLDPKTGHVKKISRIGEATETGKLAERLIRRAFFGQSLRPKIQISPGEKSAGGLAARMAFSTEGREVAWRLQQAAAGPQPDEDFQYPDHSQE